MHTTEIESNITFYVIRIEFLLFPVGVANYWRRLLNLFVPSDAIDMNH